jgi:4-diphosphocytidyl-2-C-methyl-D-erythritol kinase
VFKAWDGVDRGSLRPEGWMEGRNDLQVPARRLVPEIGTVLQELERQAGVRLSRMSGSGATCFALFETATARDVATATISRHHPDWWVLPTALL